MKDQIFYLMDLQKHCMIWLSIGHVCTVQDGRDFEDYPLKNRGFGYYGEQEKQIIHRKISDKVDEKWNLF